MGQNCINYVAIYGLCLFFDPKCVEKQLEFDTSSLCTFEGVKDHIYGICLFNFLLVER